MPGAGATPDDYLPAPVASGALTPDDWVVLDVTPLVQGWLDGSLPAQGFLLRGVSSGAVEYTLGSSQHTQSGFRPTLVVEWTP